MSVLGLAPHDERAPDGRLSGEFRLEICQISSAKPSFPI
jgi:hypothetical protein